MSSAQTKHVWKRFCAWYGADVVERKYGLNAPDDWARAIDAIDRSRLDGVLAGVRAAHPVWPPTLHEFETLAKPKAAGPNPVDILDAYVREHYPDHCSSLSWIGNAGAIVGVHVQGVGKIMLRDVQ